MRLLILTVLAFILGCSSRPPTLPASQAYADILRWRSAARQDTTAFRQGVDSILGSHGLTRDEFLSSIQALARDPGALDKFVSAAEQRVTRGN